jgi:ubiquinone/menaquinone biosynthesis C-methylase UbiE
MSFDPVAFRSDRLPTEHFDERFSAENLDFWIPLLLKSAQITPGLEVLDVGCGTGGFARAIAGSAPAEVTGLDRSARFINFARRRPRPQTGTVRWVVGDGEQLPFAASSFDRVLLSLVLHQLADPRAGVVGAVRVLRGGGLVLVRTIAPEDVAGRARQRFIPRMAAADAARLRRSRRSRLGSCRQALPRSRPTGTCGTAGSSWLMWSVSCAPRRACAMGS